jgi:ATP-dependent DNA helicase RecG
MKYPEGESSTVELKREFPKNEQILKTIIGFCNQNGGKLIIGVDDDGTIVGVPEEKVQQALEYLEKSIFEASCPPILPFVYVQTIGDKTLLIVQVSAGMNKPYYVKSEGLEKGTYIRLGRSTLRATADTIEELKWQSRGKSFDTMPVYHASLDDIDMDAVERFFKTKRNAHKGPLNNDMLISYHIVMEEHAHSYPTVAGILLFGKQPQVFFPEAMVISSHFAGISGREALATRDCTGTLVEQFNEAYAFILSRLNRSFKIIGKRRKEVLEIPEIAIREILVNALVHRNYHINAPTKIAIFDNRVEIFSPGTFPGPLNTQNLRMGLTYIRNIAIAKIFREMGLVEKLGSGFITLFESYEQRGLKEPEVLESDNAIKCILPRPTGTLSRAFGLADEVQRILHLFDRVTELSIGEIVRQLHMPRATVGRRLSLLVKEGLLKKIGQGRAVRYVKA